MNDLKTAERSSLGEKLDSLMMWHTVGKELWPAPRCQSWTFCRSSGRWPAFVDATHRGQQPPKYGHTVKVEEID